jgi:hypothetical protein
MFSEMPNYTEVNDLVEKLSPLFVFSSFKEDNKKKYQTDIGESVYEATNSDDWSLIVSFHNRFLANQNHKHFCPEITFKKLKNNYMTFEKKNTCKKIVEQFEKVYKPDFEKVKTVIQLFIDEGVKSGLFHSVEMKKYTPSMSSHFIVDDYYKNLRFCEKNIANITFNNVLKKGSGKNSSAFKKATISVKIMHIVSDDNKMKPYFVLRIPYSTERKVTCVIPLSGESTIYFTNADNVFKEGYFNQVMKFSSDPASLKSFFKNQFKDEMVYIISKTLKITEKELDGLTSEELKDYFTLVEMMEL